MLVNPVAGRPVVAMCWDTLAIGVHVGDCFPGYEDRDGLTRPWKELCRMSSNKLRSQKQALQDLQAIIEAERALQAQLSDLSDILIMNAAKTAATSEELGPLDEDIADLASRPKQFRCYRSFDSAAASWKDPTFKFKNLAATVFTSSRGTLE